MGLLTFAGRIILVVSNIAFILVSLCLAALGFLLRYADDLSREYAKPALVQLQSTVSSLYGLNLNTTDFRLGDMVSDFALFLILVGLFLLAMSLMGCCGACYSFTSLMLLYAIIIIALVVCQLAASILIYGAPDTVKDSLRSPMKTSLSEYEGIRGSTTVSLGWNWVMSKYKCCGVTDYNDFTGQPNWNVDNHITPVACCTVLPTTTATEDACAGEITNAAYGTIAEIAANSNYDKGCLDALWETLIEDNKTYFLLGAGFAMAIQIVLIVFACLIYKDRGVKGGLV